MLNYNEFCEIFTNMQCKILKNEVLSKHTTFKIGGPADILIEVPGITQLTTLIEYVKKINVPFFIIGNGSNLLVSDSGFRGIVIKLVGEFSDVTLISKNKIKCGCGASLAKAGVFALQNGLSGLEFAWGIPGSCGGAIYMNAGAYDSDMASVLDSSTHITPEGKIETIPHDKMELSYRKSIYTNKNYIIMSIDLKLTPDNKSHIRERMYANIKKRKFKQPLELPNCGSVFKRPGNGYYAGSLIENAGLKGKRVGDAMVSPKHAGFIINTGNASCKDVSNLIKLIKHDVFNKFGIMLECEIKTLGDVDL